MKFNANEPTSQAQSKNFLRLKDKESIVGIFRGDIATFYQLWTNGKPQIVDSTVAGGQFRFRINFICKDENGNLVSKLWDGPGYVYQQLKEMHEEYDLEKTFIKITRNGMGTDTAYTLMPMIKQKPNEAQIAKIPLQELVKIEKSKTQAPIPEADDFMNQPEDDDIPF